MMMTVILTRIILSSAGEGRVLTMTEWCYLLLLYDITLVEGNSDMTYVCMVYFMVMAWLLDFVHIVRQWK